MPITTLLSVLTTIGEFIGHWLAANAAMAAPISLSGGYLVADLTTDQADLQDAFQDCATANAEFGTTRLTRMQLRSALYEYMLQYRPALRVRAPGTARGGPVPKMPSRDCGDAIFIKTLLDLIGHWTEVNAGLGIDPLLLGGGRTLAQMKTDADALINAVTEMKTKQAAARDARRVRDEKIAAVLVRLMQYKDAARVALFQHPEMIDTIPNIYPGGDVSPHPVVLAGEWSAADLGALLTWTPNADPDFARYVIRYRPGEEAPTAGDTILATFESRNQTTFLAEDVFTPATGTCSFRVWVVDASDHQRASNVVTVTRPA